MKKLLTIVFAVLFIASIFTVPAMANPAGWEKGDPGWYKHSVTGAEKYYENGHPGEPSQWKFCDDCGPPPEPPRKCKVGHYEASPMAGLLTGDGFSYNDGNFTADWSGVGEAGGTSLVDTTGRVFQTGFADGSGTVDPVDHGSFVINELDHRAIGVWSGQHVESEVSGGGLTGMFSCCNEVDIDLSVSGYAESAQNAYVNATSPGQGAFASGGGLQGASYFGEDFESSSGFLGAVAYNYLEGSADAIGGTYVDVSRVGTGLDEVNSITSVAITGGMSTADVVEPGFCGSSQPDFKLNTVYGNGGVNGGAYTSNPSGSFGVGTYSADYSYNNASNAQAYGGGIAGGQTTVTVGTGYSHVTSSGFSASFVQ